MAVDSLGRIIVAGRFSNGDDGSGNLIPCSSVALWNGTTWIPFGAGLSFVSRYSELLVTASGDILVAGSSVVSAGASPLSNGALLWNGSSWVLPGIVPPSSDIAMDGAGNLYSVTPPQSVYRITPIAPEQIAVASGGEAPVTIAANEAIATTHAYLGGLFSSLEHGGNVYQITNDAMWDGNTWSALRGVGGANGRIYAVGDDDREWGAATAFAVGGAFTRIGGVSSMNVALFEGDGWIPLGGGVNDTVFATALETFRLPADVYVGGCFLSANNPDGTVLSVSNVARFERFSNQWEGLGGGVNGKVRALHFVQGPGLGFPDYLYVGGEFTEAVQTNGDTLSATGLVLWNSVSEEWEAVGDVNGGTATVYDISSGFLFADPTLFIGGNFLGVSGSGGAIDVRNVARMHLDNLTWSALGEGVDNTAYTVSPYSRNPAVVVVGGEFLNAIDAGGGLVPANYAAWWTPDQWTPVAGGFDAPVRSIALGKVFGGDFTTIFPPSGPPVTANHTALGEWPSFDLEALGTGTNGPAHSVLGVIPCFYWLGETAYFGGDFTLAGGGLATGVAKWQYHYTPPGPNVVIGSGTPCGAGCSGGAVQLNCDVLEKRQNTAPAFQNLGFRDAGIAEGLPLDTLFSIDLTESGSGLPVATFDSLRLGRGRDHSIVLIGLDDPSSYAPNPEGVPTDFSMVVTEGGASGSAFTGDVRVVFVHGVTDAPPLDISSSLSGALLTGFGYGAASDVVMLSPEVHHLDLLGSSDGISRGTHDINLVGLEDRFVTILLSGFDDPASNGGGSPIGANGYAEGKDVSADNDGDGVRDIFDACPASETAANLTVRGCESGVSNRVLASGCTFADEIAVCDAASADLRGFSACVLSLLADWRQSGNLSGPERLAISRCLRISVRLKGSGADRSLNALALRVNSNPVRNTASFAITVPASSSATLEVFSPSGRRVRSFPVPAIGPNGADYAWDLLDRSGRRITSGVYFVRLATERNAIVRKVIVVE